MRTMWLWLRRCGSRLCDALVVSTMLMLLMTISSELTNEEAHVVSERLPADLLISRSLVRHHDNEIESRLHPQIIDLPRDDLKESRHRRRRCLWNRRSLGTQKHQPRRPPLRISRAPRRPHQHRRLRTTRSQDNSRHGLHRLQQCHLSLVNHLPPCSSSSSSSTLDNAPDAGTSIV